MDWRVGKPTPLSTPRWEALMSFSVYHLRCACGCETSPRYVGLTAGKLADRLRRHRGLANPENQDRQYPTARWIRKHGPENIRIELIQEYDSLEEMSEGEKYWIAEYRLRGYDLLNIEAGGLGEGRLIRDDLDPVEAERRFTALSNAGKRGGAASGIVRKEKAAEDPTWVAHLHDFRVEQGKDLGALHADRMANDSEYRTEFLKISKRGADNLTERRKADPSFDAEWRAGHAKTALAGRHKRWHVNRNIVNPDCQLCKDEETS